MVTKHKSGDDIVHEPFVCTNCPPESYYGTLVQTGLNMTVPVCENCKKPLRCAMLARMERPTSRSRG